MVNVSATVPDSSKPARSRRSACDPGAGDPPDVLYLGHVPIYKILLPAEWDAFEAAGRFDGSPFDQDSGFIHLSGRDQVAETARRVFANEPALVIVAIDEGVVAESLRWETSPDHGRFPHVYGSLPGEAVVATFPVAGAADIDSVLPPGS
jgi:uncharacterized protein (DUF952 family)